MCMCMLNRRFQLLLSKDMWNRIVKRAKAENISIGEYIFILNDDVVFLTKDWDKIAYEKLESAKTKDGILYGKTYDTSVDRPPGGEYSSFPVVSRSAFNTLGFVMHNDFVGLGGDSAIFRVYRAINRVVDLTDIQLDHTLHNEISKVLIPDLTAYHMRLNSAKNLVDPTTLDVSKDIEKLQLEIAKF